MTTLSPDIMVIGGGSAGLTVAAAASSFGHKVVLAEADKMGGDCLNSGCVPSKSLIAAARAADAARSATALGITAQPAVDYSAVHRHIHSVIDGIAPHDSQERFEGLGVTVLRDYARFTDAQTVECAGHTIRAKRMVIATGSRPRVPPIPGLVECDPLTNESVFDLTNLPGRLAVIGGGAIGCELGDAFSRLGSEVTILEGATILAKEDPDAAAVVRHAMSARGVTIREGVSVERCERTGNGVTLHLSEGYPVTADRVLVATGRAANIEKLGLDAAGIETTPTGIRVDKGLRTTNRKVYALGDVAGGLQFTHVAGHHASLAVRSIVFRMPVKFRPELMPRATFTSPEVAQVGLTEAEAKAADPAARAFTAPLADNDRARTALETEGFVKLILSGKGKLMGTTIVAPHAGEMIAMYALAMSAGIKPSAIASFTPPYPTLSEAGKRAATQFFAEKLSAPWVKTVLGLLKKLP